MEVALRIHEADADERHAEIAGLLAVIAGEDAEAAGVDRQRLVRARTRPRSRRPTGRRDAETVRDHHVCPRRACVVQHRDRAGRASRTNSGSWPRRVQLLRRDQAQHQDRVVRGRAATCSRDAGTLRASRDASSTTGRRRVLRGGRSVREQWRAAGSIESSFGHRRRRARRTWRRSMLPPETTATTDGAARGPRVKRCPAGERGGDGAAGRAFRDDPLALGGELHRAGHLVERDDDRSGELREQRPHAREHRLAASAVHERRFPVLEVDADAPRPATRRAAPPFPVRRRRRASRASSAATAAAMPESSRRRRAAR